MGISLTNLRHVDRGGLSREQQDGQQQEERVPSRDCETTKNHLAVVMSRMQRTTDWGLCLFFPLTHKCFFFSVGGEGVCQMEK